MQSHRVHVIATALSRRYMRFHGAQVGVLYFLERRPAVTTLNECYLRIHVACLKYPLHCVLRFGLGFKVLVRVLFMTYFH